MNWDDPEVAEMVEISASMVTAPTAWINLTADQQRIFRYLMPSDDGFEEVQRYFLNLWWLSVTEQQVYEMNSLMPSGSVISPRQGYVGADLLSDALDGRRLSGLLSILETLPLTYSETINWIEESQEGL